MQMEEYDPQLFALLIELFHAAEVWDDTSETLALQAPFDAVEAYIEKRWLAHVEKVRTMSAQLRQPPFAPEQE